MTDSLQTASEPAERYTPPSLWRLLMANKPLTGGLLAILVALVAIIVISDFTARVSKITDSTPCSVWGSANQTKRDAYAALYVKQHGPLPSGASDPATIEGVIDNGCTQAYGFDEADTVTVLESIRHQY